MREDNLIYPRLVSLAQCLEREIGLADVPQPAFLGLVPGGLIVADFCGGESCGQAWVRLVTAFPSSDGISPDLRPLSGLIPLSSTVEVGILRCAPMPDDDGTPPGVAEQLEATRLQLADMNLMLRAIECCFPDGGGVPVRYTPIGPDGDCIGGAWTAQVSEVL